MRPLALRMAVLVAAAHALASVALGQAQPGRTIETRPPAGGGAITTTASAPGLVTLSGFLAYPQRIALPGGVLVQVDLVALSRDASMLDVVAAQRFRSRRQVPIPFVLAVDPSAIEAGRRHALRARLQDGRGRVLWATRELVAVDPIAGVRGVELRLQPAAPVADLERREDVPSAGEAMEPVDEPLAGDSVEVPSEIVPPSGSGRPVPVPDAGRDDRAPEPDREAQAGVPPPAAPDAARSSDPWQDARQRGVAFRAAGRNPAWSAEIRRGEGGERIDFRSDEGPLQLSFPDAEVGVETTNARLTWRGRSGEHRIEVVVDAIVCTDPVTRERLEATVTVRLDGRALHGCGRALI